MFLFYVQAALSLLFIDFWRRHNDSRRNATYAVRDIAVSMP